ncbi:MAG: hypothetical protein ABIO71_00930 [Caldimonas sp.]
MTRVGTVSTAKEINVAILDHLWDGSLIGRQRLMQAREFYAPFRTAEPAQAEFARWTQRISVQSERGSAREMAGLADAQLDALEREFIRCPLRPRSPWARHGLWVGVLLIALACTGFAFGDLRSDEAGATGAMTVFGLGLVLAGLTCLAVIGLTAFSALHVDLTYGTTGLYVGLLDEQHPWLFKTSGLLRHEAAESYRQSVLRERGPLRGLDYVMMRELVGAHDSLDQLNPARCVAERLQFIATPVGIVPAEPRLVHVGSGTHAGALRTPERDAAA